MSCAKTPRTSISRILGDAIAAEFRELILHGESSPGQRLIDMDLAAGFGTSRGPVRDALAALARAGLVRIDPRTGAFVARLSPADLDEIYSLRLVLEQLAVRRAIEHAAPNDLETMGRALDGLAAALSGQDYLGAAEADMRFHRALVRTARHERLRAAWETVADQTLLVMQELPTDLPEVQSDAGLQRVVLAPIAQHDERRAVTGIQSHLKSARDAMVNLRSVHE